MIILIHECKNYYQLLGVYQYWMSSDANESETTECARLILEKIYRSTLAAQLSFQ